MKMKFNLQELSSLEILNNLPEKVLIWLSENGERIDLEEREHMFTAGKPADHMFIIVEGLVHRYQEIEGQWLVVATTVPGHVTGMLSFSRMTHYPGHTIA
jgi:CRP-like cAMP-binding protein